MATRTTIRGFKGELHEPGDEAYDGHREIWNALVDRRPGLIDRCTSAQDVAAAVRFGREAGFEIAVKCGGHGILGLCVPDGGLMIDLSPMSDVNVDVDRRRARVGGGSLLGNLARASEPHGLATTAGNVSARLAQLKRLVDPDNVFHLNQNIAPATEQEGRTT